MCAGGAAPAVGRQGGHDQPGAGHVNLARFVPSERSDEPMSKGIHTNEQSFCALQGGKE